MTDLTVYGQRVRLDWFSNLIVSLAHYRVFSIDLSTFYLPSTLSRDARTRLLHRSSRMITLQERSVRARGAIQGSLIFLQRLLKRPLISAAERDFNLHSDLRPLRFLQVVGQSKIRFRREDQMQFAPSTGLLFLVSVLVLAGCESTSQWSPTVDTYGNSRAQYLSSDMEECRSLARSSSGDTTEETVRGVGIGAFAGAAGGAILGAMVGSPARGAALGAAAGAAGGGAFTATQTEQQFKQAFSNCMRERGHNVID